MDIHPIPNLYPLLPSMAEEAQRRCVKKDVRGFVPRALLVLGIALMALFLLLPSVQADEYDAMINTVAGHQTNAVMLDGEAGRRSTGIVRINQAAGHLNQQASLTQLHLGAYAQPSSGVSQLFALGSTTTGHMTNSVLLSGEAFAEGLGVLGITQTAGALNQQINHFSLGRGAAPGGQQEHALYQSGIDEVMSLEGEQDLAADVADGMNRVALTGAAVSQFSGLVQINQVAGQGNSTFNRAVINLP